MSNYLTLFASHEEYDAFKASSGFVKPNVSHCIAENEIHYSQIIPQSKRYLTFIAKKDGTFSFSGNSISYSIDNGTTWENISSYTKTPTVAAGNKIMWRSSGLGTISYVGIGVFHSTAAFEVEGNIMSLVSGDSFAEAETMIPRQFSYLFSGCTGLTSAENMILPNNTLTRECYKSMFFECSSLTTPPQLPATTLADNCYESMFYHCGSLTTTPKLPATTLASNCYKGMFNSCTSLTTAPELPATTLTDYCYNFMFNSCTSLTTPPQLPATTLASYCYEGMFNSCTSLTTPPQLPATTLASYCYEEMFQGCTSLTTAPQLPATTLVVRCYCNMFQNCTSLNSVTCLATDISATNCTKNWVSGVAASGTFTKAASMSSWPKGTSGIPSGWTIVDATI